MENLKIRTLFPDEIEVKVQSVKQNGLVAVLYKDSRVDMNILDETFGTMGWKNTHEVIDGKTFCTISLWDKEKNEWVTKSNVGSLDSNNGSGGSAKVKGEISDSFKRAATVVGIGRELYTSPFIWIGSDKVEITGNNGKFYCRTEMRVNLIEYDENRRVSKLEIVNSKTGAPVYRWMNKNAKTSTSAQRPVQQEQPAQNNAAQAPAQETVQTKPAETQPATVQNTAPAQQNVAEQPAPKQAAKQPTKKQPKAEAPVEGTIQTEDVPENTVSPGDAVIPMGYAKGTTISAFFQKEAKRAVDKGLPVDADKIFEYFMNLSAPQFDDFKANIVKFKNMLKKAS